MNQLLLVSSGLGALVDFIDASPKKLKLVFIPTAGNSSKDPWWVDKDRKTLKQMGFQFREFDIANKSPRQLSQALSGVNIVFVAGGNTFYLLDMMQRCNFAHFMSISLNSGVQYVGGSAGAIVAGPNIEPLRNLDEARDAPGLKSTKGLGLVDFVVIPHVNQFGESKVSEVERKFGKQYKLIRLNDDQALVCDMYRAPKVVHSNEI